MEMESSEIPQCRTGGVLILSEGPCVRASWTRDGFATDVLPWHPTQGPKLLRSTDRFCVSGREVSEGEGEAWIGCTCTRG
jgi:hypothetical protein